MALPPRLRPDKAPKVRRKCPSHTDWVGGFACSVPGCKGGPIEVAHVREGTNGGVGVKPTDDWVISLCANHHRLGPDNQHLIGEPAFERLHNIDMKALASEFANKSPHRAKLKKLGALGMRMAVR